MRLEKTGPFQVKISLRFLKERFEELLLSENWMEQKQAEFVLDIFEKNPILVSGTDSAEEFLQHKEAIDQIMAVLFPPVLTKNEIKGAVLPYSNDIFYCTERLQQITNNIKDDESIFSQLFKDYRDSFDLLTYAIILNSHYNYQIDFGRPKTLYITDKNEVTKCYRATFNGDFLHVYPNEAVVEITEDILTKPLWTGSP